MENYRQAYRQTYINLLHVYLHTSGYAPLRPLEEVRVEYDNPISYFSEEIKKNWWGGVF